MKFYCIQCTYFTVEHNEASDTSDGYGHCHRYPPNEEGDFPPVATTDWCGEFKLLIGDR